VLVDTHAGQLLLSFEDDGLITVNMGVPRHTPALIPLTAEQEETFYTVQLEGGEQTFGAVKNPHPIAPRLQLIIVDHNRHQSADQQ
jgi:diaminopimelate epimerase